MALEILHKEEIGLAQHALAYAQAQGAQQVRLTLTKSLLNLVGVLNGQVDKVSRALDRSLQLQLFVDGRYGSFSTNRLDRESLEAFVREAIGTVRLLEEDALRSLPAPERLIRDARDGQELKLYDSAVESLTAGQRRALALQSCFWGKAGAELLISEEGEYSDSVFDSLTLDSQGLYARHTETSFEIGYESTVADAEGRHFSSYWWDATPRMEDLQWAGCAQIACRRALAQMNPQSVPGGVYKLVVDSECASKLVTPLLNALGGYALQQHNSFLVDSLGEQVFGENLTLLDLPLTPGETGCRLFDSEGVATREMAVVEKGVVKTYFLNTYIARKMGQEPTIEDATRIQVMPTGGCQTQEDVLRAVGDGILVTGFNGGNSNPVTGEFSYGIEGFRVCDGHLLHPVREMLITGDLKTLWNHLLIAADDARPCLSRRIPTLAFSDVSFSA